MRIQELEDELFRKQQELNMANDLINKNDDVINSIKSKYDQ